MTTKETDGSTPVVPSIAPKSSRGRSMPWVRFYLNDMGTRVYRLSTVAGGAYIRLLMQYLDQQGPLEDNDRLLANTAGLTLAQWRKIRPEVMSVMDASDGRVFDAMADAQIDFYRKLSAQNTRNANARYRDRVTVIDGGKIEGFDDD